MHLFDLWCLPPFCLFHVFLLALQKVMGRAHQYVQTQDLRSGHGSTRYSPRRNPQRSGWGFRIQHLSEQTQDKSYMM